MINLFSIEILLGLILGLILGFLLKSFFTKKTDISSFEKIISNSINLNRDKLLLRVIRDGNEFWLINPFVIE